MTDDELHKIAAESPENVKSGERLHELYENLQHSLLDLRR